MVFTGLCGLWISSSASSDDRDAADASSSFDTLQADYEQDMIALSDETSSGKCVNHRTRAAVLALRDQPPLCGDCALVVLGIEGKP